MPIELGRVKNASDTSLKLAQEVENKFDDLMVLTGRLLEVSQAAKGSYEEQLKEKGLDNDIHYFHFIIFEMQLQKIR